MTERIRQGDIPGVQLRYRRRFEEMTAQELWLWLVETARLEKWMADRVASPGPDRLDLWYQSPSGEIAEAIHTRAVLAPARWTLDLSRPALGWPATPVTFELDEGGGATELSILQQGFQHLPLSVCLSVWEEYRERWARALGRLARAIDEARA